jgi:tetratricopeptide (TPR) repeat protein
VLIAAATAIRRSGDLDGAQHLDEQALAIARATHDIHLQARALQGAGQDAELQGDFVRARTLIKRALTLVRRGGWRTFEVYQLTNLGRIAWKQGDLETARALADEALVIARPLGSADPLMHTLLLMGNAARDLGNLDLARDVLEEAVALGVQLRDDAFWRSALTPSGGSHWRREGATRHRRRSPKAFACGGRSGNEQKSPTHSKSTLA